MQDSLPPEEQRSMIRQATRNRDTCLPSPSQPPRRAWRDGAPMLERLRDSLQMPSLHPSGACLRVMLLSEGESAVIDLAPDADAQLVVGRHEQAGLGVQDDSTLSLRHVLILLRSRPGADGPTVDLIPLSPSAPVQPWPAALPGDVTARGTALLCGNSLLFMTQIQSGLETPSTAFSLQGGSVHVKAEDVNIAVHKRRVVSSVPPRSTFIREARALLELHDAGSAEAAYTLEVRRGDLCARLGLLEAWLAQGILLGRSQAKCSHPLFSQVLSPAEISRSHVYVRREGDYVVFYDTASMGGVWIGDEQVHRAQVLAPLSCNMALRERQACMPPLELSLPESVSISLRARGM
jgi:hypothetical protein